VSGQEWAFVVVGAVGAIAALRMVTTDNVVHGALYLVITLAMVGGAYLLLAAEFVAWVQIVIYVGAIVVLLLFSLMLTKAPIGRAALDNQQRGLAALVGASVLAGLIVLIQGAFSDATFNAGDSGRVLAGKSHSVGSAIFGHFVLPFEVVSVLLLAALIGAIALARREEP
jgi:NADH-quinone oxidoreductase subunit J